MPAPKPPILAAIEQRLRALPADNPAFATDAVLVAADWIAEAALHLEIGGQRPSADAAHDMATRLRVLARQWRALAPVFAAPAPGATSPASPQEMPA